MNASHIYKLEALLLFNRYVFHGTSYGKFTIEDVASAMRISNEELLSILDGKKELTMFQVDALHARYGTYIFEPARPKPEPPVKPNKKPVRSIWGWWNKLYSWCFSFDDHR